MYRYFRIVHRSRPSVGLLNTTGTRQVWHWPGVNHIWMADPSEQKLSTKFLVRVSISNLSSELKPLDCVVPRVDTARIRPVYSAHNAISRCFEEPWNWLSQICGWPATPCLLWSHGGWWSGRTDRLDGQHIKTSVSITSFKSIMHGNWWNLNENGLAMPLKNKHRYSYLILGHLNKFALSV